MRQYDDVDPQAQIGLWRAWVNNPTPETSGPLLNSIQPIIERVTSSIVKSTGFGNVRLPKPAVQGIATYTALNLLRKFDPSKSTIGQRLGAQRGGLLNNTREIVGKYQNLVRPSRDKSKQLKSVQEAMGELAEELGRPPSDQEIGERIGMPRDRVSSVRAFVEDQDFIASGSQATTFESTSPAERALNNAYTVLPPQDQALFDMLVTQRRPARQVAKIMNMKVKDVESSQRRFGGLVASYMR